MAFYTFRNIKPLQSMIAKIANMKKILFLFLLSFTCNAGFAQRFSFSTVEQVEGGGIVYELEKTPVSLTYENILNNKVMLLMSCWTEHPRRGRGMIMIPENWTIAHCGALFGRSLQPGNSKS